MPRLMLGAVTSILISIISLPAAANVLVVNPADGNGPLSWEVLRVSDRGTTLKPWPHSVAKGYRFIEITTRVCNNGDASKMADVTSGVLTDGEGINGGRYYALKNANTATGSSDGGVHVLNPAQCVSGSEFFEFPMAYRPHSLKADNGRGGNVFVDLTNAAKNLPVDTGVLPQQFPRL